MNNNRQTPLGASVTQQSCCGDGRNTTALDPRIDALTAFHNLAIFGIWILLVSTILTSRAMATASSGIEWREITPALSDAVLFNPGMGLYLAGGSSLSYRPEPDAWVLSLSDIVYFRPTWNDLEADGPGTGFDAYFEPIFDFWVRQRGKRVAFRVMSESTHYRGKYATPKWVFDQGVPSVLHRVREQSGALVIYWDDFELWTGREP